jgi:hypothetical protein
VRADETLYDRPYDEQRLDRYLDDPRPEPVRPEDVLDDEERAEQARYWRENARRRR